MGKPKYKIVDAATFSEEEHVTDENGISYFSVNSASWGKRLANNMIDSLCILIILYFFNRGVYPFGTPDSLNGIFFEICLSSIYYFVFEAMMQRTPGKIFTDTIVIDEYGNKPGLDTIIVRSICRMFPFEAISFLGGGRGWHDKWSKTFVITLSEYRELQNLILAEDTVVEGEINEVRQYGTKLPQNKRTSNGSTKFKIVDEATFNSGLHKEDEEGLIYITVETAGPGTRILNYIIDAICFYIFYVVLLCLYFLLKAQVEILSSDNNKAGLYFFTAFAVTLYYTLFESLMQKTPGKLITKTIVIDEYGNKPDLNTIIGRSLIRLIPFDPISFLSGRGWHDRWSNTFVVTLKEMDEIKIIMEVDTIGNPEEQRVGSEEE